ncbi:MAG: hypothetical protein ACLUG4_00705 [Bacilli bacterium]
MALIRPKVPIDNKSSLSIPVFSNFLTIWATNLKLCSISLFLASKSLLRQASKYFVSSSLDKTSGKFCELIAPSRGNSIKVNSSINLTLLKTKL